MKDQSRQASTPDVASGVIPLPQPLKQKIKDGLVALSLANLCLIDAWFTLLYDTDFGFYNDFPVKPPTLLALATNFFWLALLFWLVMQQLRRFRSRTFHLVVHLAFFVLLLIPLSFVRSQLGFSYRVRELVETPASVLTVVVAAAFVIWKHDVLARAAAILVAVFSPMAVFNLVRIALLCAGVIHLRQANDVDIKLPPPVPVQGSQPRVVWIIFDELDYRLVFEQRPAGLQLPAFDRLRNGSLFATNAYPPADGTILSMPSLISGQQISRSTLTNSSDMAVMLADTGKRTFWRELPSVFSSARELGVNTALVGWAIPYARVLGKDLNYCVWHPFPGFQPARAVTYGAALLREIACMAPPLHIQHGYVQLYLSSMRESLSVVTNRTYGLTLLHLFPPHAPGIYLPDENRFTIWDIRSVSAYFNNLVLADHSLEQLRRAMETSGEWDKTWVILSADHSWRKSRTYDSRRDFRVPYLVKPAGANKAITYPSQFNTVVTHDLILAILRGEMTNEQDLVSWLDAHQSKQMPIEGVNRWDR